MNAAASSSLWLAVESFNAILSIGGRPSGAPNGDYAGVSDDNLGVRWNIRWEKATGIVEPGVNLQGMKYSGWLSTLFIENEMKQGRLLALSS